MGRLSDAYLGDAMAPDRYPRSPGFKTGGASRDAAHAMKPRAPTLRDRILAAFPAPPAGLTADEAATAVGSTPFAARPRLTELWELGLIEKTLLRRANISGASAHVWVRAPEGGRR